LRQLPEHGRRPFGDRFQVTQGDQSVEGADRPADQVVEAGDGLPFVLLQVRPRMPEDRAPAAPLGVHPQRAALRHRATGQEHRRGLAEQRGDMPFQVGDDPTDAVDIGHGLRVDRGEQLGRPDQPLAEERILAGQPASFQVVVHPASMSVTHGHQKREPLVSTADDQRSDRPVQLPQLRHLHRDGPPAGGATNL
jgi:hypothetical protein